MRPLLLLALFISTSICAQSVTVSGTISGTQTDTTQTEPLIGAFVLVGDGSIGTATDFFGKYSIKLAPGEYTIKYSYTGYKDVSKTIVLGKKDTVINVAMKTAAKEIEVVTIRAKKKDDNIKKVEMSTVKLDIQEIKKVPALLGEADVIKSIQLLPGVSTVGEGATGFNVRGGGVDQNLVLMDDAPVFNSSHLFGFFSVFNPDAVKSVKLIKGGIPSEYGGRLSSILDVKLDDGSKEKFGGQGGVGLLFSRLALEGPIVKDKGSFVIAGRRSYADILAKPFLNDNLSDAQFYFYDLTAKLTYDLGKKDKLYLSGYYGRDVFGAGFFFNWGNATSTLRWNHKYNEKLISNVSAYYSNYDYKLGIDDETTGDKFDWSSAIVNYSIKPEWTYYANEKNTIVFGAQSIYYDFNAAESSFTSGGISNSLSLPNKYALESAVHIGNEQKIGKGTILKYGVRLSGFQYLGKGILYEFQDGALPLDKDILVNETQFDSWQNMSDYYNVEPRVSAKFQIDTASSFKLSYNRMSQYIHLMSNTAAATPLDIWTPSTNNIKPQIADQIAMGYFRNFGKEMEIETSVEVFYKNLQNQIGYIPDANLTLNPYYEGDLLFGNGRAYGVEFLVKKTLGKFTGWLSYTLSRSEIEIEEINNGKWYPSRFDRTHVGSLVLSYAFTKRLELSANFVYNTGIPATFASNSYSVQGYNIPQNPTNSFNNSRVTDYHRLDLSFTIYGKEKEGKKFSGDWVFSVYNAYNRRNAFTIFLDNNNDGGSPQAIRYSIIGSIIPAVTYNFKF